MDRRTEKMLRAAMKDVDRKIIERAYQRAMNIRDESPFVIGDGEEERYAREYRRAFRSGNFVPFRSATRRYLKMLRKGLRCGESWRGNG